MKILTVNIPESFVEAIESIVGDESLYPSRSELIRVAVRQHLLNHLDLAKEIKEEKKNSMQKAINLQKNETINEPDEIIKIPVLTSGGNKYYKVIR